MIQINELRIGNFIKADNEKVWADFYNNSIVEVTIDILMDIFKDENLFSPIPLTPEILEKCGFEMDAAPQVPEWRHKSGFFFFDKYGTDAYSIRLMNAIDVEIKHLHQLQNLYYSLTQTELKINL